MSVEIGTKVEGESRIRRSQLSPDKLIESPEEGVETLYDVVQRSVKKYGDRKNAFGYRKIEKIVEEEKEITKIVGGVEKKELKTWKYFQLSGYYWLTYNDIDQEIRTIGAGLIKLGLNKGSKITIFASTRLRFVLSPISKETQEFLYITLCPILQGYGMTESCGTTTILMSEQFTYGSVGTPAPCIEVKLVAVPDAGYKSTNTPNPQGEVWIQDGWLQTGDIGEWKPDGCLAVIDRKKNLVKLAHGEYIALERLESVYKSTLFVSNICVCADSYQSRPVALIFPIEARVRKLAMEKNITETDFEKLCQDKEITNSVLQACLVEAKKADFKPAELLSAITLLHEEWTTENQFTYGSVGTPAPCIEVKLVAVPDAGYKSTNTPNPQGEVWIQDGWLQTGDIGEWKPNGSLPIIDRKKNLVKLAHGEYIALEKLESVLQACLDKAKKADFKPAEFFVEIGTKVEGESRIRRSQLSPDKLIESPEEGVETLYDVVQRSVKKYGDRKNAFGYRKIEKIVEEEKEITKIVGGVEKKELKTWKSDI
ncbi:11281_t:CDS:2 [Entrophospora sp. SA101]|nr:11281_t:CDS:2 [Entrophospora sp. SA101]